MDIKTRLQEVQVASKICQYLKISLKSLGEDKPVEKGIRATDKFSQLWRWLFCHSCLVNIFSLLLDSNLPDDVNPVFSKSIQENRKCFVHNFVNWNRMWQAPIQRFKVVCFGLAEDRFRIIWAWLGLKETMHVQMRDSMLKSVNSGSQVCCHKGPH